MIENIKSIIYKVFLMILFFVFAKSCVSDYVKGEDEQKIEELTKMINDNTFAIAELSTEYTVTTIAKVVKLYKFDYSFDIEGQKYSGKITLNERPNTNKLKLYYLQDNPNIVSFEPEKEINKEKEKGKSISDLLIGIIWGLLSLTLLISLISKLKKKKEKIENPSNISRKVEDANEKTEKEIKRKEKEDPSRFMP